MGFWSQIYIERYIYVCIYIHVYINVYICMYIYLGSNSGSVTYLPSGPNQITHTF